MENINEVNESTQVSEVAVKKKRSRFNLFVGIMLFLILFMVAVSYGNSRSLVRYEYMTLDYYTSESTSRTGTLATSFTSIDVDDAELSRYGYAGWEVISSYLEMETAFPNLGNQDYVTGIQPNVRPQRLVLILKRPIKE